MSSFKFSNEDLDDADLIVDAVYKGGDSGNFGDDPLTDLLDVMNNKGFRKSLSDEAPSGYSYVVLFSNDSTPEWPDKLDKERGLFIYYGDNRDGENLLSEPHGNKFLEEIFDKLHQGKRRKVPPIFVFTSHEQEGRDRKFRGLAVPGDKTENQTDDLAAIWKTDEDGDRFQNYRSKFTILDVEKVSRSWIDNLENGRPFSEAPKEWLSWVEEGAYDALKAESPRNIRKGHEQKPEEGNIRYEVLQTIINNFGHREFEFLASEVFSLMDKGGTTIRVTQKTADGGRDAIGRYKIGLRGSKSDQLSFEYHLEAKCNSLSTGSGVGDLKRLLSRVKPGEFGVFVTTSYVAGQAYEEIKEDNQPVLIISGKDITDILIKNGIDSPKKVENWAEGVLSKQEL